MKREKLLILYYKGGPRYIRDIGTPKNRLAYIKFAYKRPSITVN